MSGLSDLSMGDFQRSRGNRHVPVKNDITFKKLTEALREYAHICVKLREEDYTDHYVGMKLEVLVTHVENEKFFWAQIVKDVRHSNQWLSKV